MPPTISSRLRVAAAGVIATLAVASAAVAHEADATATGCALSQRSPPRAVVKVIDGETLLLDDGSAVRLIGALAPRLIDTPAAGEAAQATEWPVAQAAQHALEALAIGRSVTLAFAGRRKDRHGRLLAQVFVERAGEGALWLQGEQLARGHARAYGIPENFACLDQLIAAEAAARASRLGLWASPAYGIRNAHRSFELMALRSTYQLVEGRVASAVRTRSGRIYLNFGRDWRRDFTVSVGTGLSRGHPAWAASLIDLKGRRVRVRGWIIRRNGPMIEIEDPQQLEFLEGETSAQGASGSQVPAAPWAAGRRHDE